MFFTVSLYHSRFKPDRNNWAPRLGFAWTATPRTVVRGAYGISYIHFHRAGGGNLLSINGPQVITPSFRRPIHSRPPSGRPNRAIRGG